MMTILACPCKLMAKRVQMWTVVTVNAIVQSHTHAIVSHRPDGLLSTAVYAVTDICQIEYIRSVDSVFQIIAEPNRRAILNLLLSAQRSVGDIERELRMPQPTVSKHLRVLREAGFVDSMVDAQRRLYRLRPEPLQEIDAWLAPFRRFWSAHVDALERHLDQMEHTKSGKKKPRRN